jgi:hypothetical protein
MPHGWRDAQIVDAARSQAGNPSTSADKGSTVKQANHAYFI